VVDFDYLRLLIDNITRWNSVYRMLDRAVNVRERIIKFICDYKPNTNT
jgi:hypothetical protein